MRAAACAPLALANSRLKRSKGLAGVKDGGFSLLEVVASMLIFGIVFSALALAMQGSLVAMGRNKEFQAATQLMSRRIEEVRALAYDTLAAGANASAVQSRIAAGATDGGRLVASGSGYTYNGEQLLTNTATTTTATPLTPEYWSTETVDDTSYTISTYVTRCYQPEGTNTTCNPTGGASDQALVRVTVVADWTPPTMSGTGSPMQLRDQSLVYSPTSCLSSSTHPFSAPCQAFQYAGASGGTGVISVKAVDPNNPAATVGIFGADAGQLSVYLPNATASLQVEQSGRAGAAARGASIAVDALDPGAADTTVGGDSAQANASNDPAQPGTTDTATLSATAPTKQVPGAGNLGIQAAGSAANGTAAATMAANGTPACASASGTGQLTGTPVCADAALSSITGMSTIATTGSHAGADLAMTLASVSPPAPGDVTRTHVGAYSSANAGSVCATAVSPACVVGDARSFGGQVVIGSLPAGMTAPPGWLGGALLIDASRLDAVAERGAGAASPANPAVTGTPTVRVWNGSGYTSISLASVAAATTVDIGTASVSSGAVTVELLAPPGPDNQAATTGGTVTVGDRVSTTSGPANCSATCEAAATFTGVTATVHVLIREGATAVARLIVSATISAAEAHAAFEPASS